MQLCANVLVSLAFVLRRQLAYLKKMALSVSIGKNVVNLFDFLASFGSKFSNYVDVNNDGMYHKSIEHTLSVVDFAPGMDCCCF